MKTIETSSQPIEVLIEYSPDIQKDDADLIFKFFIVFSRFEYALKKSGYVRYRTNYLKPDWEKFSRSTQSKVNQFSSHILQEAFQYYLTRPPKIQAIENQTFVWKENKKMKDETDYHWIIRSVRIVRNNLFHGGKFPWEAIRDKKLLSHGLTILYYCLELNEDVSTAFKNP